MTMDHALAEMIRPYAPERLDVSARGSGLNAVWKIRLPSGPAVLKTYAARRGPTRTWFLNLEHLLTRRTPYTPSARHRTEEKNLRLWRRVGLDVPRILDHDFQPPLPLPCLCLEYLEGRTLLSLLSDPDLDSETKDGLFRRFLPVWATRHRMAEERGDPALVQEHASFDHIMVAGDRWVTFDLEVSYASAWNVRTVLAREICACLLSVLKKIPDELGDRFIGLFVESYPDRARLRSVSDELLNNPHLAWRILHRIDRRRSALRNKRRTKFDVARRIRESLP